MNENKNYNDKNKMYDIMNTTQSNYSNMLKRLREYPKVCVNLQTDVR